jgi:peptide chain release factor 3
VPRFSPEHFAVVRSKDPLRRKQIEKGLEQLAEEGTIQIFQQLRMGMKDPIVGVVGALQFEVLQYRVQHEYGASIVLDKLPFQIARWVVGPLDPQTFDWEGNRQTVTDRDGQPLVLFRDDWALQHAEEKHPELRFLSQAPQLHALAPTG